MIKKILVAFDDSEASYRAFDFATDLAEKFNAKLILLAIVRLPEPTTSVEVGHPPEHIVALAEREHVDLIVMGRRGRTQVGRFILGSTSERVLRYAHCAVTVVK